jgi:RNA polymerase sigma-70 factor (ECF subfamily)
LPIDEAFRAPMATTPSPEESVIISQRKAHFDASLNELSDDYRQIIEMRFLDEYSYEEIAEKLNKPINTVKTQIRRAKAAVCKIILDKE